MDTEKKRIKKNFPDFLKDMDEKLQRMSYLMVKD